MNKVTLEHCKTALAQTRACLDRELYIALAVMCGVTCERYMAYDADKLDLTGFDPRSYLNKESGHDKENTKRSNELLDIRNKAVHAEHAYKFDPEADQQALKAWNLLQKFIKFLIKNPAEEMKLNMRISTKPLQHQNLINR